MENMEPGKKPKKVNSEIRKQQNRIASRNYREKRKRKLQYLQQLLQDSPTDQHTTRPDKDEDTRAQSVSSDYYPADSTHTLTSESDIGSLCSASDNTVELDSVLATTTSSYSGHILATSQPYQNIQQAWNSPYYDPLQQQVWEVSHWLPGVQVGYSPQMTPTFPDEFQYSPPQSHHFFDPMPSPPLQNQELIPDAGNYLSAFAHCGPSNSGAQPQGHHSVSAILSPYYQAQYLRTP